MDIAMNVLIIGRCRKDLTEMRGNIMKIPGRKIGMVIMEKEKEIKTVLCGDF